MRWLILLTLGLFACGNDRVLEPANMNSPPDAGEVTQPPVQDAEPPMIHPDAEVDAGTAHPDAESTSPDSGEPAPDAEPMRVVDPPALRPYSNGTCPTITAGPTSMSSFNEGFISAGDSRSFRVLVPMSYDPSREWPVMFAWHWLNASSGSFVEDGELETAIEEMQMIAVLPDKLRKANGDKAYYFDWPFVEINHAEKELVFFDDLLTCVSEQYSIDRRRVYGIGVSAGALWLTHMMSTDRIDYLAAVESLSGGLGELAGVWQIQYTPRAYKFPAVVLWGGPRDRLGVNFAAASERLRDALLTNQHFVVTCEHSMGHAMPPISPPPGSTTKFWSLWRFMLDHPYGVESPYRANGLPMGFPDWCSIP